MDDLLGEDWQKPAQKTTSSNAPPLTASSFAAGLSSFRLSPSLNSTSNSYPALSTPASGRSTPQNISRPGSTINGSARPSGGDAFGNLLGSKAQKGVAGSNMSIQERQKQLLEEKRRQQEQQQSMWDTLGGRGTPEIREPSPMKHVQEDEDDIMAAFNKDAPVDKASHFPPPASGVASGRSTPAYQSTAPATSSTTDFDEDDDPFGLGAAPKRTNGYTVATPVPQMNGNDDDDILGDLGKPVVEKPARSMKQQIQRLPVQQESVGEDSIEDRALAELVDMGFPADNAKIALAENGGDVQGAVGWLLQQAHEESKQKSRAEAEGRQRSPAGTGRSPQRRPREQDSMPSWMRQESRSSSGPRRQDNRSPAGGEKDPAQVAQEYGTKFLKGATSLWKASQKQMAKTMSEFQQERDPSQPKWMQQDTSADTSRSSSQRRPESTRAAKRPEVDMTDEAAMLDAPREKPQKPARASAAEAMPPSARPIDRTQAEPLPLRPTSQAKFMQQAPAVQDKRPVSKLSRQDVEDQTAQAYVSPARRKRPTPQPEPQSEPEVDLFSPAPAKAPASVSAPSKPVSRPSPSPVPTRPKAPPRNIPSVSTSALTTSAGHRRAGGEAFKRGDYASAHESYTAALNPLPATHPIAIIVLSNRSLTALKTGDAKMAVADADRALSIIGPSHGVDESIVLGAGEGAKEMREFYAKAIMRKAEALEHMERWVDAAGAWRAAVEAGVGGAISIRGRDRCERAAAPKPTTTAVKPTAPRPSASKPPPAKSLGNSLHRPALTDAKSAEAVKKLRAQNAAADKADDEKFALTDQVEARLTAWKGGKSDNLRALLQSLDAVLWESAGWKKVGMSDLVLPNKVKVIYMKAIAKVHPDKIAQDATTEQRMISASVFSTLNEAWDKFKKDNNL